MPSEKENNGPKAIACVKCGTCVPVCPVFEVTGREAFAARGKNHLLDKMPACERTVVYEDIFSKCLLCCACVEACPRDLDTPARVIKARADFSRLTGESFLKYLARRAVERPGLLGGLCTVGQALNRLLDGRLPADSGLRLRLSSLALADWRPSTTGYIDSLAASVTDYDERVLGCVYFVGCLANHLSPEIGEATSYLTEKFTGFPPVTPRDQACCGLAALAAGNLEEAQRLARRNIEAFSVDNRPILTSCASCYAHLRAYPDLLVDDPVWHRKALAFAERLREFSSFFYQYVPSPKIESSENSPQSIKVFYHDPCHLRFKLHITAEPRKLLKKLPGIQLLELVNGPRCCGQGGFFGLAHPELAHRIRDLLMADFTGLGAEVVTTTCSGCLLQWRQGLAAAGSSARALHLAVFLKQFFG